MVEKVIYVYLVLFKTIGTTYSGIGKKKVFN
jgi:hypothetical protein